MSVQEAANVKVTLNNEEAKRELDELNAKIQRLINLKKQAEQEGDVKGYKQISAELTKTERQAKRVVAENQKIEQTLKNLNGASLKDLETAKRVLLKRVTDLKRGTEEWKRETSNLSQVNSALRQTRAEMGQFETPMQKMIGFAKGLLPAFGFAAVIAGLRRIVSEADSRFLAFEERIDNLSSITGLAGEELDWLSERAKELSTATLEGGIIITKSANDIIDAFTKMGSARPELLKDKEALAQVTEQALILSEAAKIDMDSAINTVAASMNQFNLGASQSSRIINVIAAGSLEGSSEVADLTESMKNVGPVASDANMSLEQTVAALEVLGEKQLKGAEAGTKLRGVILKLQEDGYGYASGQFNLGDAIEEVNTKLARQGTELERDAIKQKLFGTENVTAGSILLQNAEKYDQLTKAVTGTNTAMEQAAINTDNEAARRKQAQNQLNVLYLEFGQKIAPIITKGITSGMELLNLAIKFRVVLIPLTVAIAGYWAAAKLKVFWDTAQKGATIAAAGAQALFTGNLTKATAAMRLFNTVTKLNPFVLIASLVAAAGVTLFAYSQKAKEASASTKALLDVETEAQKSIIEEKVKVEQLLRVAQDEKRSKDERLKAIKELNEISPQYLGGLTLEKINTDSAKKATDEYIKSIEQKARVQAAQEMLVEIEQKRIDDLKNGEIAKVGFWNTVWNGIKSGGNVAAFAMNQAESSAKNATQAEQDYLDTKKELLKIIDQGNPASESNTNNSGGNTPVNVDLTDEERKKRIKKLEASYNEEVALIRKRHLEGTISEDQYNSDILQAELKFLKDKLSIYKVGSKEYEEAVNQALQKQVEVDKTIKSLLLQAEKELADAKIANLQDGLQKQEIQENQRWANEKANLEKRLIDKAVLSEQEIALNDAINQIIEEKEAAHQEKMKNLKAAGNIEDLQNRVDAAAPVDPNFSTTEQQQALFDAKTALIEAQYDREKQLAGNNQSALLSAEQRYNQQMYQIKSDQIDAEYALTEKRIGAAQSYVSMLAGVVDEESALGKALFLFNQALAIGDVWVNIAKANAKAIAASPLTFGQPWVTANTIQGGVQTALILAQTVAKFTQHESGKYPVIGADDGNVYDANFSGKPKTGIYSGPQLGIFNENPQEPELVVDGKTTRQLIVNYPAIYRGIRNLAAGFTPQFAEGKYPNTYAVASEPIIPVYQRDIELQKAIDRLNSNLEKGVRAVLIYRDFEEYENKVITIRDNANL